MAFFKYIFITVGGFILLIFLIPIIFPGQPDKKNEVVKKKINSSNTSVVSEENLSGKKIFCKGEFEAFYISFNNNNANYVWAVHGLTLDTNFITQGKTDYKFKKNAFDQENILLGQIPGYTKSDDPYSIIINRVDLTSRSFLATAFSQKNQCTSVKTDYTKKVEKIYLKRKSELEKKKEIKF